MSGRQQYNDKSKVCNLDISFELNNSIEFPIETKNNLIDESVEILNESQQSFTVEDKEIAQRNDRANDEKIDVNLNISFDHNDLEPISFEKYSTPVLKISQGIIQF